METVEARESRLARDAKFEELRVDVEAQLRQLPSETIGGTLGGLQFDNQMSFSTSITEAGEYAVASTCNPAAATSIHVVQGSTSWTTAVPCGDLAETVVPVEPGQVRISLQSLDSEFFVGAIFLVKAEP
ncbi:hypothetical protein V1638_00095 [Pseudarthrobacter sp. J64]|uniref:hypothetical protein n=1 Tax=Pseudarthrobacter sp. J64 TaxID=3116485 RepID=UPI002E7FB81E|nr:hypothetical protein [Pseudarthrobacter sp. J64]MEE2567800.1 hypothetical protein [Pseudarthrobacter sp. J64]